MQEAMTMDKVTLRILTPASRLGIGRYAKERVDVLLSSNPGAIRYAYYHFESIDFVPEVLESAGIRERIAKPGVNHDAFVRNNMFLIAAMTDEERIKYFAQRKSYKLRAHRAERAAHVHDTMTSRGRMAWKNQGH